MLKQPSLRRLNILASRVKHAIGETHDLAADFGSPNAVLKAIGNSAMWVDLMVAQAERDPSRRRQNAISLALNLHSARRLRDGYSDALARNWRREPARRPENVIDLSRYQ
jgi:hypothetical protein